MTEKNFSQQALDTLAEQFDRMEGGDGVNPAHRHYAMAEAALTALSDLPENEVTKETFEYRVEYDDPYLRNRHMTRWTPAFPTVDAAVGYLQSWAHSNDYGEVLTTQRRRITRGPWEDTEN